MKKKHISISVSALLSLCVFSGCNEAVETWKPIGSNNTITIAVAGDDTFYMDGGTVEAMELASKDFQTASGVDLNVSFFDDDADYHKAISYANEIASDPEIAAVIIKQEIDFVDTVADIYEKAGKPFIITNGCYEHTRN